MFRELKLVRGMRADVGEELRGWRWGEPPVAPPPLGVRLSVSEIVGGYCESRRDLYLRRVLRVRAEPNGSMKFGAYIHEVFRRSLIGLRRLVEEGAASGWELIRRFDGEALAREAAEAVGAEPDPRGGGAGQVSGGPGRGEGRRGRVALGRGSAQRGGEGGPPPGRVRG